MLAGMVVY